MGIKRQKKKKQPITVRVFYPETAEGIKELRETQSKATLDILEKQLGEEGLKKLMKRLEDEIQYKN
ncbi:hypothetical protein AB2T90_13915 [Clostridium butyricum]|uniref:hypothetical protein n=1 Tax=Clostridium butyricum TaxID=1492 RepID=UPI003467A35B